MGAGNGPDGTPYSDNRATLHLHGGNTPWISDGTPHQWTAPAGETTNFPKGISTQNVPDMPTPGDGEMTFYYTNQQSGRLLFYHDHAYGITRLNVYAGEAAGYLITDPAEDALIFNGTTGVIPNNGGGVYTYGIPLIIQDKTFVDASKIALQDPTWNWGTTPPTPNTGDLWFPHVYMPNQNPYDDSGANAMGRWDYGPWFWPIFTPTNGEIPNPYFGTSPTEPPTIPGIPNPSMIPEAFMDTPVVNGTAYPVLNVEPKAYRFRVLNACNDRYLNLQLYQADPAVVTSDGRSNTEVKMIPAAAGTTIPAYWPRMDGRDGGVPDPLTAGPNIIQIGTESGFLAAPVELPNTPIGYNYNRRDIVVLNVQEHTLYMGPAERADIIIDFSAFAGKTLILYNDAPAPVPAFDPRTDYYTLDEDQTSTGGAPQTLPGFGPNTRTMMQIVVGASTADPFVFSLPALQAALPPAFAASQPAPIVPEAAYGPAYGTTYQNNYARIQNTSLSFAPDALTPPTIMPLQPKAIQELFELDYGRMNATLGVERPNTNATIQTTIPYGYIDPPTEMFTDGETQIWKLTHNGVDTHAMHFHLFDVQVINRVGWDGAVRPPEATEMGWKETVKMNPLEDIIFALRPHKMANLPWPLPNSIRPLDVTRPIGSTTGFFGVDPDGNPVTVLNQLVNYGWEYVWHCHLLGHEENDMMRASLLAVAPEAPSNLTASVLSSPMRINLNWTDNSLNSTGFTIQRATDPAFTLNLTTFFGTSAPTYSDTTVAPGVTYYFRVLANNTVGSNVPGYPTTTATSTPSNTAQALVLPGGGVDDLLITNSSQGTYIWNSVTGAITNLATPADLVAAGDFDGDGLDDPMGNWAAFGGVWMLPSTTGQWTFLASPASALAAGDISGDGKKDLIGVWAGATYYLDSTSGLWVEYATPAVNVTAGDLDGDNIDDLIGNWPNYGGVWVKFSTTGQWVFLAQPSQDLAVGDMNGDGRVDLIGTWDLYGTFYRDSMTGQWFLVGDKASQVTAGSLDGDAIDDLVGVWPALGGILVNYSTIGQSAVIGTAATDITSGKFRLGGAAAPRAIQALTAGLAKGPRLTVATQNRLDKGPGGKNFAPRIGKNLVPQLSKSTTNLVPGPGQPGFKFTKKGNIVTKKPDGKATKAAKASTPEKY